MVVFDQANALRRLVERSRSEGGGAAAPARVCTVVGGKGGVGVTTAAVNIATAFARQGDRTLLVDADPGGGNVGYHCGLDPSDGLAEVLSGEKTLPQAVQEGPGGLYVLASLWTNAALENVPTKRLEKLADKFRGSGRLFDTVVVDAGTGLNRVVRRFWRGSDAILLVTTPDLTAVMDGYATIKVNRTSTVPTAVVANFCNEDSAAGEVFSRLSRACGRFLSLDLAYAGRIAKTRRLAQSARNRTPFLLEFPDDPVSDQWMHIATTLETLARAAVDPHALRADRREPARIA